MIRVAKSHLSVAAQTHPGMSGKNNEDRYAVSAFQQGRRSRIPALFAIISDGIGGHRAGEVAAEMTVEGISRRVAKSSGIKPLDIMEKAIVQVNQEIYAQAQADPACQGMGATCACAWIIRNRLYTASIGDSRIYLMRGSTIQQISTDHTWIQEALDRGVITPKQAHGHPNTHVIRRYLGGPTPPQVDFRLRLNGSENDQESAENQGLALLEGDRLLLCSDGLTDLVTDPEILAIFQQYPLENAMQALVDLANQRGGHDNITLVAIQAPKGAFRSPVSMVRIIAIGLGMLLLAAIITVWWFFGPETWDRLTGDGRGTAAPTLNFSITQAPAVATFSAAYPPPATAAYPPPTVQPSPSPVPTLPGYQPAVDGPTLTPWPTNTLRP